MGWLNLLSLSLYTDSVVGQRLDPLGMDETGLLLRSIAVKLEPLNNIHNYLRLLYSLMYH